MATQESDLVLVIFIHGFKGTDETFGDFPQRLQHLLLETLEHSTVEVVVFPAYETKGELDKAVVRFADWLTTLTVEREVASGLGAGKAKVVLCGHSMGGLLAADTLREFVNSRPDKKAPLWPKIVACIAYDTPYYGLHPFVVKNGFTRMAQYANTATTIGSTLLGSFAGFGAKKAAQSTTPSAPAHGGWGRWAGPAAYAVGGALIAGAAAGGAYYKKDELTQGFSWATDHMKYVGNLWDDAALEERINALVDIERDHGVVFRNIYSVLPANPPEFLTPRTFVVLPKYGSRAKDHFLPSSNAIAPDETHSHTGMFGASTNDGYYRLGLASSNIIRDAIRAHNETATSTFPTPQNRRRKSRSPTKEKLDALDDRIQI
ncbi:hypothetical protein HYPSUDRAFT_126823 [Hypholoma sublateritium FD-334 SS-4]|uniref:AB hydrolase-1 domain-containing protein n=1 Tax=Hypholoma sublateritium (strain FD-334 SS-4) TaxID=945553 RepID=A0A0D2QE34_HYPSF|nr:hypothetical protein HYPSUDRAFT_126823 [Hypholoma sublateritium FD-334 SS-4]